MDTRSFREQQFFLNVIIKSRVLRSFIILNRTKKALLYNPVLVFLIYLHQTHHAPKDAELSLKKILFCDIANKNETLEKLKIRKASPLIKIYIIVLFVHVYYLIYIFMVFLFESLSSLFYLVF